MNLCKYIIHLPRATSRFENATRLKDLFKDNATIIDAIDGRTLQAHDIARYKTKLHRPYYPFELKPAEIATFLSHRACWQRLLDDDADAALIVEDDIALGTDFEHALSLSISNAAGPLFFRFPQQNKETGVVIKTGRQNSRLLRPTCIGLGMVAQVVTRDAAEKLLAATMTFDRPVDTFLQMRWIHQVDVLSVWPSGVTEVSAELGGTLIHENKNVATAIWREIRRPLYRTAIKLRSAVATGGVESHS